MARQIKDDVEFYTHSNTQSEISGSLVDLFNSVFEDEPFENQFERNRIRYVVEWIDLALAYAEGRLSPIDVDAQYQKIRIFDVARGGCGLITDRLDFDLLYTYRDNVEFLLRKGIRNHEMYYTSRPEENLVSPTKIEPYYDMLEYFTRNPLSSFSTASKALGVHPTSISRNFKNLQLLFHFSVRGETNRWLFGLRTFILFFELHSNSDFDRIRQKVACFPYYNIFCEDLNAGHHYISFVLPADKSIAGQFIDSIAQFSRLNFKSWRLHELIGQGHKNWTDSFTKRGWSIPKMILEDRFPSPLDKSFKPRNNRTNSDSDLTARDFVVLSLLTFDVRKSAPDLARSAIALANNITESEAYYRKIKLLNKEALCPVTYWYDNVAFTVRLEVICNKEASLLLISAASECTTLLYGLTSEGVVLFLNVPLPHLSDYTRYFSSLLKELGIADYTFVLSKYWAGGHSLLEIVRNWNYGPKGFTTEGLNISADIYDYI